MNPNETPCAQSSRAWFATTRWSVVLAAKQKQDTRSAQALETLCRAYWVPLYAFVRRQGYNPDQAGDLTQGFFTTLLERNWLAGVTRQEGRFRNFLMVAMKHYISNERAKARAIKRGGACHFMHLDIETAETRYRIEPIDRTTPEQTFERQWALALLDQVLNSLKSEYEQKDKASVFVTLKHCLTGQRDQPDYQALARKLETSQGAVRVMVHRLKDRYRSLLREHIAHTVFTHEEIELELQHLRRVLTGS